MADPRPLTRQELAEFLPSQRAVRAFEKLFDLVPLELGDVLLLAEEALVLAAAAKSENMQLKQQLELVQLALIKRQPINLDQLLKRVENLETLEG